MKQLIVIILLFPFCFIMKGQTLVLDPGVIAALEIQHLSENSTYGDIKDNQSKIKTYQIAITATIEQIKQLEQKTLKYLSTVNAVVQNGQDIVYASKIATDIAKYQSMAYDLAANDPILVTVAAKTEYELVNRSLEIVSEIYNFALVDGEKNMLNNKERIDMIKDVVQKLQVMRGCAYSICSHMKAAKRYGIWKEIAPREFQYYINTKQISNDILKKVKNLSGK